MVRCDLRTGLLMSIGVARNFSSVTAVEDYTAFITPSVASKDNLPAGSAESVNVTGNVTGGTGPFTFAWARVSGDIFTINSPSSQITTFSTSGAAGSIQFGVYRFTVTDNGDGNAEESADIDVTFEFAGPPV